MTDQSRTCLPQTLKLGDIVLDAPMYQAPLSGYTDRAMRSLARQHSAPMTFAGVMLDKITLHPKALRKPVFAVGENEHPIGGQLLGSNPEQMAQAAKALCGIGYDLIDLNFACPAPKVLRRGRGGALLQNAHQVIAIYRKVRETVRCPLLMKLRIAYDDDTAYRDAFWTIAEHAAADGIDALVVHGRTVLQRYRGKADWQILAELKRRLPGMTIVGSGDIFDAPTVVQRFRETGIDGVLVARGAIGNPWIFEEIRAAVKGDLTYTPPTLYEQGQVILEHWSRILQLYPPKKAIPYFRKFLANYCRRHPDRKKAQMSLMAARDPETLTLLIEQWYDL